MAKHYLLLAIDKNDGTAKYIDEVPNGKNCGCICAECKGELEAKNNGKKRAHHFAHADGSNNIACSQTALHLLAKKIIAEEKLVSALNNGQLEFVKVPYVEEEKDLGDIRPDLYAEYNGKPIAIEIFVTHAVGDEKYEKIQSKGLTTFEIDLSGSFFETRGALRNAIYCADRINLVYDEVFMKGVIQEKKKIIMDNGILKPIENGFVKQCPMLMEILNGVHRYLRPKNVKVDACKNCFFSFFSEDLHSVYCMGNVNGKIPDWFLRADVNANLFMSMGKAIEKKDSFKRLLRNFVV